jgi:ABC-type uncharacterized transport system permease subunit
VSQNATGERGSAFGRIVAGALGPLVFPVIAIVLSFIIGAVIILLTGNNPIIAYASLVEGAFGDPLALGRTLLYTTPLIFTGLAVAVAFRAGLFNIGGEGQIFVGAVTAAWLGVSLGSLGPIAIPLVLVGSLAAGFLWGAIPGVLKAYFGAHEVITPSVLNYVGIYLADYLANNPLRQKGPIPGTETIDFAVRIPVIGAALGRANYGFVLAILAAAARPPQEQVVLALAIGGSLAGLGGGVEILGVYGNMDVPWVSNLGFNGIGVALLGRNHPVGVVLGALLFGALFSGAQEMQFATNVPLELTEVLLAVILLLVTATKLVELIVGKRARALAGARLEEGLGS